MEIAVASSSVPADSVQPAQKGGMLMSNFNFQGMGPNLLSAIALIWSLMTTPIFLTGTEGDVYGLP